MAYAVKIDYCDLVNATKVNNTATLLIRDDQLDGSVQKYQPIGEHGDFAMTEIYGEDSSPKNSYGLKVSISPAVGAIKLNKICSITTGTGQSAVTKKYALESVKISTSSGKPVTISATAQEIEDDATDANQGVYWIPAFAIDKTKFEAQDIFGAFTKSGEGCHLTDCTADIKCTIGKDDVAGVKISSDAGQGVITVSGTILSTAGNVPTVTAATAAVSLGNSLTSNWVITKPPAITETNPEKAAKNYTFELQLPLKKYRPTPVANGD